MESALQVRRFRLKPSIKIALGFLVIMFVGGVLLSLPVAVSDGERLNFLDALFSSFSAVCVTGLSVVEIGEKLSLFGQIVMLALIQVGGLGFMTATSLIFMAMGKRFTLKDRMAMQESLNEFKLQGVVRMTRNAVFVTGVCELLGIILLSIRFIPAYGFAEGLYYSIFHSISAFCNAGFDVFGLGNSLVSFASDPLVLFTIMALIVLGGLGFFVVMELTKWTASGFKKHLSLQSKVVVSMTLFLILAGMAIFVAVEWENPQTIGNMGVGDKFLNGLFQSVTTRTAGFASINQTGLKPISSFLTIALMFIGASPAGTGGGVKTTTVAIVLLLLHSIIRGKEEVSVFHRRIGRQIVLRSIAIMMISLIFVLIVTFVIILIEAGGIGSERILFEVVSAFGTVGLSQSVTPFLSPMSKVLIMMTMYVGRVGLMAFIAALAQQFARYSGSIRYPEEKIMVG